jgi:hypothetical protein
MGPIKKKANKILGMITADEAERLLLDWVNLKHEDAPRFMNRWHPLIGNVGRSLFSYQESLRKAWDAPNSRTRSWYLFTIRHAHAYEMRTQQAGVDINALRNPNATTEEILAHKELLEAPPEISALEAALYYLQEGVGDRAKHCGYDGCRDPYFVAEKGWQKYCSEKCAAPSNREAKRKWWHEKKGKGLL